MTSTGFSGRMFLLFIGLLTPVLLESCGFCVGVNEVCYLRSRAVIKKLTASSQTTVFESPGTLIVYHGSGCSESKKSGTEDVITVKQSVNLPSYATQATVILNGWDMQYLDEDHHVAGLGTIIDSIRIEKNTLTWRATGMISDQNFDDSYQWCYHYTIIAWNSTAINLIADHQDGSCELKPTLEGAGNFMATSNTETTSALSVFPSFLLNQAFSASKAVAILPRGFGFAWTGCDLDHHLFQLGYSLGHSEVFIEHGKPYRKMGGVITPSFSGSASQVGAGYVSWETSVIFKDDDGRRDYHFGQMVSALAGSDLGIIDPPFSILPMPKSDGSVSSAGVRTQKFVITNIPYNYAIPVLSGWDVGYLTSDNHVREGGMWISNIRYEKNPAALTGTLSYELSSVLRDDDNSPGFYARHKVTVLGFQAATGKVKRSARVSSESYPDLVPYSPLGNGPRAFGRIEPGQLLRVTVKNQGSGWAAASKTSVTFNGLYTLTSGTPELAPGASVDLTFKVPANCGDCNFAIRVDAADEVNESANESNNSTPGEPLP